MSRWDICRRWSSDILTNITHCFTGTITASPRIPTRDPELLNGSIPTSDTRLAIAYSGVQQLIKRLVLMFRHAVTGRVVVRWIPENKRGLVVREARIYALVYLSLLSASVAWSSTILLWVWLVPLVIGQLFLRPYLYAEHTGCERTRSAFENTRTTYTGRGDEMVRLEHAVPRRAPCLSVGAVSCAAKTERNRCQSNSVSGRRLSPGDATDLGVVSQGACDRRGTERSQRDYFFVSTELTSFSA